MKTLLILLTALFCFETRQISESPEPEHCLSVCHKSACFTLKCSGAHVKNICSECEDAHACGPTKHDYQSLFYHQISIKISKSTNKSSNISLKFFFDYSSNFILLIHLRLHAVLRKSQL